MTDMKREEYSDTSGRWLALLLSPITWMVYFVLVYLLDEAACAFDLIDAPTVGRGALLVPALIVLTLITLAIVLYGGYLGWRLLREARRQIGSTDQADNKRGESEGEFEAIGTRDQFVGISSIMLSLLFAIFTIGMLVVVVGLPPC